ncbi:uncharacterized protein LOC121772120 isoform X1 [Salvia splendens]|uniref:uncharacterized protein LOC121772120 isoform X1 n=1 Tax=Salvia splendens TaxID=180675 RepID=UPI001C2750CA|nr:uncharacterized protein LOC121772120 isoform X1 [Salvia splendens]XP_042025039.1 uncharacterized protein LOC121772120 isoform X1 [Salvia splendens]
MARRSSQIREVSEGSELSCMWGLFSILESCQGCPASRNIIDYPRPLNAVASFDEECQMILKGAGQRSGSVRFDGEGRSVRSCIGDEMPAKQQKSKRDTVKRQQYGKTDGELVHHRLSNTRTTTRKTSQGVYLPSSSCCLNSEVRSKNELPSTSAETKSLDKITLAAILGAACAQNHQKEIQLSEYLQRNSYLGKYDDISIKQVRARAKALVDQIYVDRRFVLGEGMDAESKLFSNNALEVLNSKNMAEKDTIKSVLGKDRAPDKYGSTFALDGASMDDYLWQKIDNQLKYSSKENFTAQPPDKIVILKPAPRNGKHSGNLTTSCSSLQLPYKSSRRVSEERTASFSFREIKKKLKHSFGVTKKENRNCCSSSTNAEKEGKVSMKQEPKSSRGSDIARVADTTRKKLYISRDRSSDKKECDVILEAKRHLSTRLNNLNSVEADTSRKNPRTLERILSSPEHDSWPFSPRRDSIYCPGSAEMRFCPYNTLPRASESSCHERNGIRSETEVASLQTAEDTNVSTADKMRSDGESKTAEMGSILQPASHVSGEVLSETTHLETTDTVKEQKCDGTAMHSVMASSNDHHIDSVENIKFHEEHQSPVSVLEPFFVDSPPTISLQTGRKQVQPHRLDFEECSFISSPQHTPASAHPCSDEHLCQYVQLVIEASSLDWDHLSEIISQPEHMLLHESLFDEIELPPLGCYYDPKLLFDRINEVLLEIYKCHLCSPPFAPPKTRSVPLAEVVLDEILAEADYFLLPSRDRRSLDEIVLRDAKCGPWLDDIRFDKERVVVDISEALMEGFLLDTLLQFYR